MRIDIITLFPKMFSGPFDESIIKRAQNKKLVKINIHNLRDWAIDMRGTVDDKPYGGGTGMILRPEPIFQAVEDISAESGKRKAERKDILNTSRSIILLSASGKPYNQKKAVELSKLNYLILLCGHYEGVDQRVADYLCNEEITIGDYVLTGGEIPAMVIVDSIVRLIPGVLEKPAATQNESFSSAEALAKADNPQPSLEYPQYTRPENFLGFRVPQILLSGNHAQIEKWKKEKALERTKKLRPDLLI